MYQIFLKTIFIERKHIIVNNYKDGPVAQLDRAAPPKGFTKIHSHLKAKHSRLQSNIIIR